MVKPNDTFYSRMPHYDRCNSTHPQPSLHPFLSAPPPLIHLQIKVDQMSPLEITVRSKLLTFMAHGGIRIPSWLLEPEVRRASR